MIRWQVLAAGFLAIGVDIPLADAQQAPTPPPLPLSAALRPPQHLYPVAPEAGEWLICVQTFKDDVPALNDNFLVAGNQKAKMLAEGLAEVLRREYKLNAYLYDRSYKLRAEEQARIQDLRDRHWGRIDQMRSQAEPAEGSTRLRYKTSIIPDEFAVLVSRTDRPFKDMESARDFLVGTLRKKKAPPNEFCNRGLLAAQEPGSSKVTPVGAAYLNPFTTAMVVHNPTIEMKNEQADPEKADEFLKELNADEKYSVLKCSKPWTLVVKIYQGGSTIETPKSRSLMSKVGSTLGLTEKDPTLLNASAMAAHELAKFLRNTKPSFEAYVMHQRSYSLVTVGQFDGPTDPELVAIQKSLAGLQFKQANGQVMESLNPQPLPMKIPR